MQRHPGQRLQWRPRHLTQSPSRLPHPQTQRNQELTRVKRKHGETELRQHEIAQWRSNRSGCLDVMVAPILIQTSGNFRHFLSTMGPRSTRKRRSSGGYKSAKSLLEKIWESAVATEQKRTRSRTKKRCIILISRPWKWWVASMPLGSSKPGLRQWWACQRGSLRILRKWCRVLRYFNWIKVEICVSWEEQIAIKQ